MDGPDAEGAPASKRVRRAKAPAAAAAAATTTTSGARDRRRPETLRFTAAAKDASDAAVLAEFEATSAHAAACAVGVLTVDVVGDASFGHRSNLRPEGFGGKDAAGDDARRAAKAWLDALPAGHPRKDAGWGGRDRAKGGGVRGGVPGTRGPGRRGFESGRGRDVRVSRR